MVSLKFGSRFPGIEATARACIDSSHDGIRTKTFLGHGKGFLYDFPVRSNLRDVLGLSWTLQQECDLYMAQLTMQGGPQLTDAEANALVKLWQDVLIDARLPKFSIPVVAGSAHSA